VIASLDDAREWYEGVKTLAGWMARMGRRYWDHETVAPVLGMDTQFREVEKGDIDLRAKRVSDDLDDLCVLLLFSVFESIVRDRALMDVETELPTARHPALRHALKGLREALEHGSFAKVLEAYKELDADLVEQVSQVRRYRNWVAHGRRGDQPDAVDPDTAYRRLGQFLALMRSASGEMATPSG
jgi:hypothetical protein